MQLKNQEIKKDKEDACMQLSKQNLFKTLWECTKCGKLFVDGKSGELITYEADSKKYNQIGFSQILKLFISILRAKQKVGTDYKNIIGAYSH